MKTRPRYLISTYDPAGPKPYRRVPIGKAETLEEARAVHAKLAPKLVDRDGWALVIVDAATDYEPIAA